MVKDRKKRVRHKRSGGVDYISILPDCLLCEVLSKLPTKDVVKTSVLSTRWRNLWKGIPRLDLDGEDFSEYKTFVSFVDSFLDFNSQSCLQKFKLNYDCYGDFEPEIGLIGRWINTVVRRRVKHIDVCDYSEGSWDTQMPPTIYTCESLVSLKLCGLTLASPKSISLLSLKVMVLILAKFTDDFALETLISQSPVLERLVIERSFSDGIEVLRVCSKSLLRFTHVAESSDYMVEHFVVAIDAPRLEYLKLSDHRVTSFILISLASLVEADIDIVFNLSFRNMFDPNCLLERDMIRNFLVGISRIQNLIITSSTLEIIYDYSRCEPLPLFCKLSFLRVAFTGYRWEMLPTFLQSCPNLKSLIVGSTKYPGNERNDILSGPWCFLSSLEYVEIERPLKGAEAMEMELVSYLLEKSTILKKLTLCLDDSIEKEESVILKELLTIPRFSTSGQVVVL